MTGGPRPASSQPRLVAAIFAVGIAFLLGACSSSSDSSSTPSTTAALSTSTRAPSPTTARSGSTTTVLGQGCGEDCGKQLTGDWARLVVGDCVNIKESSNAVKFNRLSCRLRHQGEVYYVARPDPVNKLIPQPKTAREAARRICGQSVLAAYAPAFAAANPDGASRAGMWGNGDMRICAVGSADPERSIRE